MLKCPLTGEVNPLSAVMMLIFKVWISVMVINEASKASMTLQETTGERGLTIFGAEIAGV